MPWKQSHKNKLAFSKVKGGPGHLPRLPTPVARPGPGSSTKRAGFRPRPSRPVRSTEPWALAKPAQALAAGHARPLWSRCSVPSSPPPRVLTGRRTRADLQSHLEPPGDHRRCLRLLPPAHLAPHCSEDSGGGGPTVTCCRTKRPPSAAAAARPSPTARSPALGPPLDPE